MKVLIHLIAIIGILHHVEAKAFQPSNVKGRFDHMYENLYLKKAAENSNKNDGQNYEMRYVPHVDGKPIFIPFDEFETLSPNVLKTRPNQLRYKPDTSRVESTKMKEHFFHQKVRSPNTPKNDYYEAKQIPIEDTVPISEYIKPEKENHKIYEDHPVVVDVNKAVVNSDHLNYGLKDEKDIPLKKKSDATKPSEHSMKSSNKNSMKQETYGPVKDGIKNDKVNYDYPLKLSQASKHEVKESIPKYHTVDGPEKSPKEEISSFNHGDSPAVVESITKDNDDYDYPIVIRPFTQKHKVPTVEKTDAIKINQKPVTQDYNLKTNKVKPALNKDTKIPEKVAEQDYKLAMTKQKQPFNHEGPVVTENLSKKTTKEYDYLVVVRSEKHSGVKIDKKEINKPVLKDNLKYNEMKPALYSETTEATKTDNKLAMPKDPIHSLSPVSTNQEEANPETKLKPHYQDVSSVESLEHSTSDDKHSQNSDYYEYIDLEYDEDDPVIEEALVQKTDTSVNVMKNDYDSPVVVEALVKKTNENEDIPMISEALIKKSPVYAIEQHSNKNNPIQKDDNYNYEAPVVVEALVKKNPHKKRVKYSTKMKPPKSSTHSHYESTPKNKQSTEYADSFYSADTDKTPSKIKTPENAIDPVSLEQSKIENFSNDNLFAAESLGDANDQFDSGSGIINERSSIDNSKGSSSRSNSWPLLTSFHSQERNKFKNCTTPSDEPGNCMPIQMCPTPNLQLTLDDLLKKICAVDDVFIGICCPEFPAETLKVDWENFSNASSDDKEETKPEGCGKIQEFGKDPQSWPWMAPLISVSTRRIFCGGVLITEQYVLTAAHCTRKIPRNQIVVVLGPSSKDATPQEFEVVEIKRHAQYNPRTMQNDLALLKLSRKVRRPHICLPDDEEKFVGVEALMLGWQGSFAASKSEEKLLVISPQECRKGATKIIVGDNIMCTEPRTEDVMCNVDSGAPLVIKNNGTYHVIGLLTWNRNDCDSSVPAIFTRVTHFKRWIGNHAI